MASSASPLLYLAIALPILLVFNTWFDIFTMSSEIKNVAIIGAGGNLGPSILTVLLESPFNVTVLSREGSKSTFPAGVKVVRADYASVDSLAAALKGQDAVLSLFPGEALGDQTRLIDGAIAAGVKRFLPSEYGSNTLNERLLQLVPPFNAKKATVDYLKSKEGLISWTSVISGPFFDWGLKVGFLGFDASSKTATLIDEGKGNFSSTNLRQIGRAVVKILQNPILTKNQYVFISSFETSQAQLLPVVEKVSGGKWTVKNVTSRELADSGNEKLKKQDFSGIVDLIQAGAFGKENLGVNPESWNEKLGLEKEDLEATVKAALSGKLYGEK